MQWEIEEVEVKNSRREKRGGNCANIEIKQEVEQIRGEKNKAR